MIIPFEELPIIRKKHFDETIVFTGGVFDIFHRGHVACLKGMQEHGDIRVVMIKSDQRVRTNKSSTRPIITEEDRAVVVDAMQGIDFVVISPEVGKQDAIIDKDYEAVFDALKPDIFYTTNEDWKKLEAVGGPHVVLQPRIDESELSSTTKIIEKIQSLK